MTTTEHEPRPGADEIAREVWEDESPAAATDRADETPDLVGTLRPMPVGIDSDEPRVETDSLGGIKVPGRHYWGAQTQRSLENFDIGTDRMPLAVVRGLAHVKAAAAAANRDAGRLPAWKAEAIRYVCQEILTGQLDAEFPLGVYQTGSGTHTNANVDEVVANRANQLLGSRPGSGTPIHPLDDVNMSQSNNDTFVTAMHVAAYVATVERLLPSLTALRDALSSRASDWADVVKVGRTHLMDATLLTVGQEWSGYAAALSSACDGIRRTSRELLEVALGGTAVGTGLNAPPGFTEAATAALSESTGYPFRPAANPFAAQATLDALVRGHGGIKSAAVALFKIANDLRWLASGPRAGLQELRIPANEPGSTIMPGKVNPTQAEATLMACLTVIGHDQTVAMAGAEGNFELNAFRPIVIDEYLRSARLLADASDSLRIRLVNGATLNGSQINVNVDRSVMVVTALTPVIGYDRAAAIVRRAVESDLSIRDAAVLSGVDARVYDDLVRDTARNLASGIPPT